MQSAKEIVAVAQELSKGSKKKFSYIPSSEVVKSFRKTQGFSKKWNLITDNKVKRLISRKLVSLLEDVGKHLANDEGYKLAFSRLLVDFEKTFSKLIFHDFELQRDLKSNKFSLDLCRNFCDWIESEESCIFSSEFGNFELQRMGSWIVLKKA